MGGIFGKNKRPCLFPRVVYKAKSRKAARVCCDAATWTGERYFHSARIGRTPRGFEPPAAKLVLEASGSESGGEEGGSGASPRARHSEASVPAAAGHTPGAEPEGEPHPELLKHQELAGEAQGPQNPQDSGEVGAPLRPSGNSSSPELRRGDLRVTPPTRTTVEVDVHVSAGGCGEPGQGQPAANSELLSAGEQEDEAGRGAEQEDEDGAWGNAEQKEDGVWRGDAEQEDEDGAWGDAEQEDGVWWGAEQEEDGAWGNTEQEDEDGAWSDAEQEDEDGSDAEHTCAGKALWEAPLREAGDTTAASCPLEEPELPLKAAEPGEGITNGQGAAQEQGGEERKAPPALQLGQGEGPVPGGVEGAAGEPERAGEMAEACGDGLTPEEIPACLPQTQEEEIQVSSEGKPEEH
ncbi:myristoylated alanine-rich C-kinase substrate-like [Chamaea fasciata]|uniref:myristoylated alanine-rich C-kinase substrate-like n=1 Tax=Chamaea fasciata TaxID=190680 RepID=UPI00336A8382